VGKMTDRNPEVLVCDASIMRNVWEIRLREYGQKRKSEQDRQEKSALQRINEDWSKRMSGKVKPKRVERKVKPPEETASQTYKAKQTALGRPSGFVSSRPQKPANVKKDITKRNKLALLLSLNEKQPGLMIWTKSWKFSQPLPQPEDIPPVSDWGQSWKLLNFQPNHEGKSWTEHEHDIDNHITYNGVLFPLEKIDKALCWNLEEDMATIDWEKSWKYTKQRSEAHVGGKNGPKNSRQDKLNTLYQSHSFNEKGSLFEWSDSWKSGKPPVEENIQFTSESVSKEETNMVNEEQSTMPWGQSWKYFKKELHMRSKATRTSTPPDWVDSWRVSKPVPEISQQVKVLNVSKPQIDMPEEPLDPKSYQTIMGPGKEEKCNLLWSSQFQDKGVPLPEWQKSWMTIKNDSEYKEPAMEKKENPKLALIPHVVPEERVEFEAFSFPRKHKPAEILEPSECKDRETFISKWKDSWQSLKHLLRQNKIRSRLQRISPLTQAATSQTSLTEWANSWRFTNLNANQDDNLWQQGWATYSLNQPGRWARENETLNEGIPRNGPTGTRGWGESWRSTRHQHRVEREAACTTHPSTQPGDALMHRRSLADWGQSWQLSTNRFHHDRPSTTEWADSWRFCSFHCENWAERQPEPNQQEKALEIKARKELPCASHRFSRSFEPQTFKERFSPQEWKHSWRIKRFDGKEQPRSGLSHFIMKDFPPSWDNSWMFSTTQLYQSEHTEPSSIHSHSKSSTVHYNSISEWGSLWKI
ncbi:hypothetical protein NFI96_014921, partial [Prochilodus magdalenae]